MPSIQSSVRYNFKMVDMSFTRDFFAFRAIDNESSLLYGLSYSPFGHYKSVLSVTVEAAKAEKPADVVSDIVLACKKAVLSVVLDAEATEKLTKMVDVLRYYDLRKDAKIPFILDPIFSDKAAKGTHISSTAESGMKKVARSTSIDPSILDGLRVIERSGVSLESLTSLPLPKQFQVLDGLYGVIRRVAAFISDLQVVGDPVIGFADNQYLESASRLGKIGRVDSGGSMIRHLNRTAVTASIRTATREDSHQATALWTEEGKRSYVHGSLVTALVSGLKKVGRAAESDDILGLRIPTRLGLVMSSSIGDKRKVVELLEGFLGSKISRNVDLDHDIEGELIRLLASISGGVVGIESILKGHVSDTFSLEKNELVGAVVDMVFSEDADLRIGYAVDVLDLATREMQKGAIELTYWPQLIRAISRQAFIEEQSLEAVRGERIAHFVDAIVQGYRRYVAGCLAGSGAARKESFKLGSVHKGTLSKKSSRFADRQSVKISSKVPDRAKILEKVLGNKDLAQAVLLKYQAAKKSAKAAIKSVDFELEKQRLLSDCSIGRDILGMGYLYDYSDIVEQSGDPSLRSGGFGVPLDYDATDPFNAYYPWAVEFNNEQLTQLGKWIQFGNGSWTLDTENDKFTCNSSSPLSGLVLNDFSHDDYIFQTDFTVEGDGTYAVGIVCKYTDPNNYYMFAINGGDLDGKLRMAVPMQLYQVSGGTVISIGSPMAPFKWQRGETYTLALSYIQGRLKITVNGILQYDMYI